MLKTERRGFEPLEAFTSAVFKTAAIDHSAISPMTVYDKNKPRGSHSPEVRLGVRRLPSRTLNASTEGISPYLDLRVSSIITSSRRPSYLKP